MKANLELVRLRPPSINFSNHSSRSRRHAQLIASNAHAATLHQYTASGQSMTWTNMISSNKCLNCLCVLLCISTVPLVLVEETSVVAKTNTHTQLMNRVCFCNNRCLIG